MKPLLVILMGSKSDLNHAEKIAEAARTFGLDMEMRIGSAHKTAGHVLKMLQDYEADPRPKVYVTIAGRSNALSGFTDGIVSAPGDCLSALFREVWRRGYLFLPEYAIRDRTCAGSGTCQCGIAGGKNIRYQRRRNSCGGQSLSGSHAEFDTGR